jgi:hypothetical protein
MIYTTARAGFCSWQGHEYSFLLYLLWAVFVGHLASYPGSFLQGKKSEVEASHLALFSSEVEDVWNFTSTPPIHLHGMVLKRS